jgi:hypothetical protein
MTPQATKLIEECSEVIHALCKVERFGAYNFNPETGIENQRKVFDEIQDLRDALEAYLETV